MIYLKFTDDIRLEELQEILERLPTPKNKSDDITVYGAKNQSSGDVTIYCRIPWIVDDLRAVIHDINIAHDGVGNFCGDGLSIGFSKRLRDTNLKLCAAICWVAMQTHP